MNIMHVLADGSVIEDITDKVITLEDHADFYNLLDRLNHEKNHIKKSKNFSIEEPGSRSCI